MKSAYELAMERLNAESGPSKKLTDEQKAEIARIDAKYDAQIAETKLAHDGKMAAADHSRMVGLQEELADELQKLEERRENEKDKIWSAS